MIQQSRTPWLSRGIFPSLRAHVILLCCWQGIWFVGYRSPRCAKDLSMNADTEQRPWTLNAENAHWQGQSNVAVGTYAWKTMYAWKTCLIILDVCVLTKVFEFEFKRRNKVSQLGRSRAEHESWEFWSYRCIATKREVNFNLKNLTQIIIYAYFPLSFFIIWYLSQCT